MVQQIEINGKAVRVLFGMHFAEHFTTDLFGSINEDGTVNIGSSKFMSTVIWFGYLNWCEVKDEPPQVTRSDVYEWVEMAYSESNEDAIKSFMDIMGAYKKSAYAKGIDKQNEEAAKKKLNGAMLEPLHSVLSD